MTKQREPKQAANLAESGNTQWQLAMLEQVLNQLGHAVMVVSGDLGVIYLSESAKKILELADGMKISNKRLKTATPAETNRLKKLIPQACKLTTQGAENGASKINAELYISRPSHKQPLHLRIMPVMQSLHAEANGSGEVIILIRDLEANFIGLIKRLRDSFNLTPRECECAIMLAEGLPLSEVAEQMHISEQTVRLHLKHMFTKMQVSKQHELVAKLLQLRRKR